MSFWSLEQLASKLRGTVVGVATTVMEDWDVDVTIVPEDVVAGWVVVDGGDPLEMHVVAPVVQACAGGQTLHKVPMLQVTAGLSQHTAPET
jgi:hypothetical protein